MLHELVGINVDKSAKFVDFELLRSETSTLTITTTTINTVVVVIVNVDVSDVNNATTQ